MEEKHESLGRQAVERAQDGLADNELLNELQNRARCIGRDEAHHPITVRRVMAALDANGPSEVGDVIHSLLWRTSLMESRARRFAQELTEKAAATPSTVAAPALQEGERGAIAIEYTPGNWFDARTVDEMQAFYLSRLPAIRQAAKEHGYAIGLHGSTRRDLDLMAMQWREDASDKDTLAHAIAVAACGITRDGTYPWECKPSGRFAVSLPICWTDHANPEFDDKPSLGHIDLSVIDPRWMILLIEKRAEDYLRDCAETEHDTGAVVFHRGEAGREYHSTLVGLADDLRLAMSATAPDTCAPSGKGGAA